MSPIPADYVDVAERIREFKAKFPDGSLQMWSQPELFTVGDRTYIRYIAAAYRTPDDERPGIGCAWEPVPGPTPFTRDSELMNAETSAWGRAIVALGFETKKIASANEVRNRQGSSEREHDTARPSAGDDGGASPSRSEGSSGFKAPATEKPVPAGVIDELKLVLKLLNSSFPEHPGEGRKWEDVAKEHCRDTYQVESVIELSLAQANELVKWLEDQYQQATREASVPFG